MIVEAAVALAGAAGACVSVALVGRRDLTPVALVLALLGIAGVVGAAAFMLGPAPAAGLSLAVIAVFLASHPWKGSAYVSAAAVLGAAILAPPAGALAAGGAAWRAHATLLERGVTAAAAAAAVALWIVRDAPSLVTLVGAAILLHVAGLVVAPLLAKMRLGPRGVRGATVAGLAALPLAFLAALLADGRAAEISGGGMARFAVTTAMVLLAGAVAALAVIGGAFVLATSNALRVPSIAFLLAGLAVSAAEPAYLLAVAIPAVLYAAIGLLLSGRVAHATWRERWFAGAN